MDVKYITYSVAEVRSWLYEGADNGLSEQIISKVRANAIIHNPYVKEDMVVVVAAKDDNKVVGYTAMFPECLVSPNETLTVPTTLYADTNYASEFIGYNVTKLLHDTAEGRHVIGTDMAKEATLIDRLLGLKLNYIDRFRFVIRRTFRIRTLRNLVSWLIEPYRCSIQKRLVNKVVNTIPNSIRVQYTNFIDEELYQFICEHSTNDIFLRSQQMLNWILHYPFTVDASMTDCAEEPNIFGAHIKNRRLDVVKVYNNNQLIGLYALRMHANCADLMMLYTIDSENEYVYALILKHIFQLEVEHFRSIYKSLNKYIINSNVALKHYTESVVFTYPTTLKIDPTKQLQGMDGDMFA